MHCFARSTSAPKGGPHRGRRRRRGGPRPALGAEVREGRPPFSPARGRTDGKSLEPRACAGCAGTLPGLPAHGRIAEILPNLPCCLPGWWRSWCASAAAGAATRCACGEGGLPWTLVSTRVCGPARQLQPPVPPPPRRLAPRASHALLATPHPPKGGSTPSSTPTPPPRPPPLPAARSSSTAPSTTSLSTKSAGSRARRSRWCAAAGPSGLPGAPAIRRRSAGARARPSTSPRAKALVVAVPGKHSTTHPRFPLPATGRCATSTAEAADRKPSRAAAALRRHRRAVAASCHAYVLTATQDHQQAFPPPR
jgi:hypothetical protein